MSISMRRGMGAIASSTNIFDANAVNFTAAGGDYLSKTTDLTGNADTKLISGSVWIKAVPPGSNEFIFNALTGIGNQGFVMLQQTDGKIRLQGVNTVPATAIFATSGTALSSGAWTHVLFSFDLSDTGKRDIYINGVDSSPSWTTYDNSALDVAVPDHRVGANAAGSGSSLNADISELWVAYGVYIDFSVAANRAKFRNSGGKPVNLGTDGSLPTGTAPILFFSSATDAWHTNKGTGGGFTENGTLTTASTSPSD